MGVSKDLEDESRLAMLHDNMNISRLMVHARRVEEARAKRKSRMLKGTNYLSYGKSGHKMRDCPNLKGQERGGQAQASGSSDAPKKNRFYALPSRGEHETSTDVVTGMLKVFSVDAYALLDPITTLSFVTLFVAKKFEIFPNISHEPFLVSTPVGESVVAKRVYKNFPIMLPNRVSYVDLVELDMFDFDIILGMD
ncbi:uncharacterized protein [Solanum lycopersicum]|uniref:uncharacterized protein n=1 Tax=Solanum lycopersicum TaxID=4081 RepID=UPI003748A093